MAAGVACGSYNECKMTDQVQGDFQWPLSGRLKQNMCDAPDIRGGMGVEVEPQ